MISETYLHDRNESTPTFEFLYQDAWLLAVNKRAYIPVAPLMPQELVESQQLPNPKGDPILEKRSTQERGINQSKSLLEQVGRWLHAQQGVKPARWFEEVQKVEKKEDTKNSHLKDSPEDVRGTSYSEADRVSQAKTTHLPYLGLVHRIDQPVTGVVLFARDPSTLELLNRQFRERQVYKLYWAVTESAPPEEEGALEHYIVFDPKRNKSQIVAPSSHPNLKSRAKKAILHYHLIGRSEKYFFLEIELITGRPHQIRAQLAAIGCPVKGDLKYGARRSNPGGGILLHARSIRFTHPKTGIPLTLTAEPPPATLWALFPRPS